MLTSSNFLHSYLSFEQRQAGVGVIYCGDRDQYTYHAYCHETKLRRDLVSVEYDDLQQALDYVNEEFAHWSLKNFDTKKGKSDCGNCQAH